MIGTVTDYTAKRIFLSTKTWILFAVQTAILAWVFQDLLSRYMWSVANPLSPEYPRYGVTTEILQPYFNYAAILHLFTTALLGCGLIAEERQRQSIVLFFTSPVSPVTLIIGYYCALLLPLLVSLFFTLLIPLSILFIGTVDPMQFFCQSLGLTLSIATFAAISLMASSFSRQTSYAYMMALGLIGLLIFLEKVELFNATMRYFFQEFSLLHHLQDFLQGLYSSQNIFYFLMIIITCLVLSMLSIRWETKYS